MAVARLPPPQLFLGDFMDFLDAAIPILKVTGHYAILRYLFGLLFLWILYKIVTGRND